MLFALKSNNTSPKNRLKIVAIVFERCALDDYILQILEQKTWKNCHFKERHLIFYIQIIRI